MNTRRSWRTWGLSVALALTGVFLLSCGKAESPEPAPTATAPAEPAPPAGGPAVTPPAGSGPAVTPPPSPTESVAWKPPEGLRKDFAEERRATVAKLKQAGDAEFTRLRSAVRDLKQGAWQAAHTRYPDLGGVADPGLQHRQTWKRIQEMAAAGDRACKAFLKARTDLDDYLCKRNPELKKLREARKEDHTPDE